MFRAGLGLAEGKLVLALRDQDALPPSGIGHHELMDRQRIPELIGDQQHRARRQGVEAAVPLRREALQRRFLRGDQRGVDLDQMDLRGREEVGRNPGGAQGIGHQAAAAGAELSQDERRGLAHARPEIDTPKPDHLAEHLAHFWRGREVPAGAEGIALAVISTERQLHELRHGDMALRRDASAQFVGDRVAADGLCHRGDGLGGDGLAAGRGGTGLARQTR